MVFGQILEARNQKEMVFFYTGCAPPRYKRGGDEFMV